eukprot:TRINITY_DN8687_c0_g2_i1.p1 TRINITY_DN8687_c0_g2~~TRINITY_DN8687_c0_g2_i1.p1  ORF type:complete len:244 (-),score=38.97 TRINITY_DN8687_c0_g2_i1:318-977(-)
MGAAAIQAMPCVSRAEEEEVLDLVAVEPSKLTAIGERFVIPLGKNMLLRMRHNLFAMNGHNLSVLDIGSTRRTEMFTVKGKLLNKGGSKVVYDASGAAAFKLTEKVWRLGDTQIICAPDGDELFHVGCSLGNTKQYTTGLRTSGGTSAYVDGKCSVYGKKGSLWLNGTTPVARVVNPSDYRDLLPQGRADYLLVEIAPGVDAALILAILLALEEMEQPN